MLSVSMRMVLLAAAITGTCAGATVAQHAFQAADLPAIGERASPPPHGVWRRTSQGWQHTSHWTPYGDSDLPPPAGQVHPLIVAVLIGLISCAALLGFDSPQRI